MITRRDFLKGLTLAIVLTQGGYKLLKADEVRPPYAPEIWLNLSEDNILTVLVNKSEMGQGVYTGLPQIVAEELDFPWDRIRPEAAPAGKKYVDPKWGVQLTGGSTSVRHMYDFLRYVGASMREMLLKAASEELGVPLSQLRAENGYIYAGKEKYPYGKFAKKAMSLPVPENPRLKDESEFKYIGKSMPRLDVPDKVNGRAVFGIDAEIEGCVYAVIERAPFGSRPLKVKNKESVKREKGIIDVIPIRTGVAVCGESFYTCLKAREKLEVEWSKSPIEGWNDEDFERFFSKKLKEKGIVARHDGKPEEVYRKAKIKLEETYILPYLYHATMEPMNCTAWVKEDECIVYAPTQGQTAALMTAKRITGLPEEKIKVYTTYLGGGFGRKSNPEFIEEALILSKKLKRPVKLIYTREDDINSGWYRPMNATNIRGSITEEGNIDSFIFKIAVPSVFKASGRKVKIDPAAVEGAYNMFYEIPNVKVEWVEVNLPVPVWFWRSVGSTHNAFTVETFIDRLAYEVKKDPVELRLKLLELNERAYRVVEHVAEVSGWGRPKLGEAMGIAYHYSFGSHVAQVAEVTYEDGKIKVNRVVCVIDIGPITVNPDLVVSQMESAIIMGLSAFLKEKVSFEKGRVKNTNFDTYPLLRMDEIPEIEVHILNSDAHMGGVGEPGLPPVAPAVANALLWGYGMRVNKLPLLQNFEA
ncbi:xanthine dehydrogenase family protein molybdopterin-binding subunit [Aquifex pyrophilus]